MNVEDISRIGFASGRLARQERYFPVVAACLERSSITISAC